MRRTTLVLAEEEIRVEREEAETLRSCPVDRPGGLTSTIERIVAEAGRGRALDVRLEVPWVQLRRLRDLPPVTRKDLRDLVRSEPHRFFRRRPTPLVIDARWEAEADVALAAACEEEVLLSVTRGFDAAGAVASRVAPAEAEFSGLRFSTPGLRHRRRGWLSRRIGPLAALALSAWIVVGGVYAGDLLRDLGASEATLDSLSARVESLRAVEARVGEVAVVAEALRLPTEEGHWVRRFLDGVSAVLPDSAHLTRLSLNRGGGRIELRLAGPSAEAITSASMEGGWRMDRLAGTTEDPDKGWHQMQLDLRRIHGGS